MIEKNFTPSELYEAWPVLSLEERVEGFEYLSRDDADDFGRDVVADPRTVREQLGHEQPREAGEPRPSVTGAG